MRKKCPWCKERAALIVSEPMESDVPNREKWTEHCSNCGRLVGERSSTIE